jgi:hypothetical protein
VAILGLPGLLGQGIVTSEFVTLVRSWEPSNFHRLRHVAVHPMVAFPSQENAAARAFRWIKQPYSVNAGPHSSSGGGWVVLILEKLGGRSAGSSGRADA